MAERRSAFNCSPISAKRLLASSRATSIRPKGLSSPRPPPRLDRAHRAVRKDQLEGRGGGHHKRMTISEQRAGSDRPGGGRLTKRLIKRGSGGAGRGWRARTADLYRVKVAL